VNSGGEEVRWLAELSENSDRRRSWSAGPNSRARIIAFFPQERKFGLLALKLLVRANQIERFSADGRAICDIRSAEVVQKYFKKNEKNACQA
jgi:hypothetical protein